MDAEFDRELAEALAAHRAGDLEGAAVAYEMLLERWPDHAGVIQLLGLTRQGAGDFAGAEALILQALSLSDQALFRGNLAFLYHQWGKPEAAEEAYLAALAQAPDMAEFVRNYACLLRDQGRFDEALAGFERLTELRPEDGAAQADRALMLERLGRYAEAEAAYRLALERDPACLPAAVNLGALLVHEVRNGEAEAVFRQATASAPASVEALCNLGLSLFNQARLGEAEPCYRRALEIRPGDARTSLNLGLLLLHQQRFAEAWPWFEARHAVMGTVWSPAPAPDASPWRGDPLAGRSILVFGEQGFGDQIQFLRFAQKLRAAGAGRVIVAVAPELESLVAGASGIDEVLTFASPGPIAAELWAPMMSLPGLMGLTPETVAGFAPPAWPQFKVQAPRRIRDLGAPYEVGIFWAGRAWADRGDLRRVDSLRSLEFDEARALMATPALRERVRWTILQRDRRPEGLADLARARGWRDPFSGKEPGPPPQDFADVARIMTRLDLVIGVDSAFIHLAAALARPTWMMDRTFHCWRWVGAGEATPWYPTLRIFRQTREGDWAGVIDRIAARLAARGPH